MAPVVGIDIGTTAVRAVKVTGVDHDGFATVAAISRVPLRADAVVNGKIRAVQTVAAAVQKACKEVKAGRAPIVIGAMASEAAVTQVALPSAVRDRERLAAVRTMEVQVSPSIAPADAALALSLIREQTAADGRQTASLAVAATLQSEIATLQKLAKSAKIKPRAIDLTSAGTVRALVRDYPTSTQSAAIVDVGATTIRVITREGPYLRTVRTIPGGGMDLTRAIAQAAKESFDDAERRKWSMRLPIDVSADTEVRSSYAGLEDEDDEYRERIAKQGNIERALSVSAEALVDQIAAAIEVDMANRNGLYVTLCGGTALMRGLKERLQRRMGAEVRLGHPWAHLEHRKENEKYFVSGREDPRVMLEMVNAIGLAMWGQS